MGKVGVLVVAVVIGGMAFAVFFGGTEMERGIVVGFAGGILFTVLTLLIRAEGSGDGGSKRVVVHRVKDEALLLPGRDEVPRLGRGRG